MSDLEVKVMELGKKKFKFLEAKHDSGKLLCPATALIILGLGVSNVC